MVVGLGMAGTALGKYAYKKTGAKRALHKQLRKGKVGRGVSDALGFLGFAKGGTVKKTGVYKLHKGEVVLPANMVKNVKKRGPQRTRRRR